MPLETATYISDLNVANPAHTDGLAQADSQMRLLKSTIKATFPNFTAAALVSTQSQIDTAVAATLLTLLRSGTNPPGMISDFGSATAPTGWLECDGQSLATASFPDLFTAIGYTWGGSGANFNVPQARTRFRRHRAVGGLSGAVGTLQNPANAAHTHPVSGSTTTESAAHSHDMSHTTGAMSANQSHTHTYGAPGLTNGTATAVSFGTGSLWGNGVVSTNTGSTNIDHSHSFSGSTGTESAPHFHSVNITSGGGSADDVNESRPYSMSVLTCIKL